MSDNNFDLIVTLCGDAKDKCPILDDEITTILNKKGYIDSEVALINKKSFYSKYKSKILLTYHIIFVLLLFLFLKKFRNE